MKYRERLRELYDVLSESYNVVVVTLNGSQNYNLHTPSSDYDAKAFIMPTFKDLFDGKMESRVCNLVETEHYLFDQVEIKDIRLLPPLIEKSHPNYLDVLGTRNYYTKDEELWSQLRSVATPHLLANRKPYLNCVLGQFKQTLTPKRVAFLTHCVMVYLGVINGRLYSNAMVRHRAGRDIVLSIKQGEWDEEKLLCHVNNLKNYLESELNELRKEGVIRNLEHIQYMYWVLERAVEESL